MLRPIVFGDSFVEAELPADTEIVPPGVSLPLEPVDDLTETYRSAIEHPIDLPPLADLARRAKRVVVAFDDPTVPCYAPVWAAALPLILQAVSGAEVTLLCANALHRQFTHFELAKLIGEDLVVAFGDRLRCHDAEDLDGISALGTTTSGHRVELNRAVVESDLTVYLNCSTTRGFSGGWKSICVGLSTYESIRAHHTPATMSMSMGRNAMHEILDEMGALVIEQLGGERIFKLETVLANPLQVGKVFGGSVAACRHAALEVNRRHLEDRRDLIKGKADVVLYGVPDWSPYAAFSHTNPLLTLISTGLGYLGGMIEALGRPGCTAILATPCPDRWDEARHPSYREVWERVLPETKDPDEARARYEEEFAGRESYVRAYRHGFGFHGSHGIMALYPLKRLRHAGRVLVAGAEKPAIVEHAGFESATSVEAALAEAGDGRVAFVDYPPAVNRT